jgi:hypothetical protein
VFIVVEFVGLEQLPQHLIEATVIRPALQYLDGYEKLSELTLKRELRLFFPHGEKTL